jgi:hypothetical protein
MINYPSGNLLLYVIKSLLAFAHYKNMMMLICCID